MHWEDIAVYDEWTESQRNNKRIMDKKGQQTAIYEETYNDSKPGQKNECVFHVIRNLV